MREKITQPGAAPASAPTVAAAGKVIADKYKLVDLAGKGGMGAVWVAEHLALGSRVALKIFPSEGTNQRGPERLLREARAAAKLKHPGIVKVLDFGETAAREPFLVMELLDGEPLSQYKRRVGNRSPIDAARIMLPIADALQTAHAHGIVHRDLKPANLFVAGGESGRKRMVVVDFGLAQNPDVSDRITVDGSLLGSPHYMSPEQVLAQTTGTATDIWSFCVVLYELVTGSPPFLETSEYLLLRSIVENDPKPLPAGTDPTFAAILQRGLAKSPDERWPSMAALGKALASWLVEQGITDDIGATSLHATWLSAVPGSPVPRAASVRPTGETASEPPGVGALLRPSQAPTRATIPGALPADLATLAKLASGRLRPARGSERSPQGAPPTQNVDVRADAAPSEGSPAAGAAREPRDDIESPAISEPPLDTSSRRAKTILIDPPPSWEERFRPWIITIATAVIVAGTLTLVIRHSRKDDRGVPVIAPAETGRTIYEPVATPSANEPTPVATASAKTLPQAWPTRPPLSADASAAATTSAKGPVHATEHALAPQMRGEGDLTTDEPAIEPTQAAPHPSGSTSGKPPREEDLGF